MNAEKLRRLQAQVRIGGKGTPRRKKKVMHQSAATDDKKLQSSLKKLSVSTIPGIEEVNIIKDDLTVIHFNNPKAQASLSANTFAVTGHGENKKIVEMLPEILPQLGQETVMQLRMFANTMSHGAAHKGAPVDNYMNGESVRKTASALDDDDDVPLLVNDFEQVAKLEEAATAVKTMKVVTFEADSAPDDHPLNAASNQFDKLVGNLDKCVEEAKVEVPITTTPLLSEVPTTNKIHNTKIQKTANECVKDEKKGNKKSNNKQQQKDQIDVHDMAAKNKTETIAEVVEVEDKKAKQMKIEKPIGQQQEVKASAAPLIVSDNVKNNKKEKQDKQKKEISLKGENKMKEAKVAGKFSVQISNDNERKVKGKKDKENFESNKCGQDAKVKEKQMKSKDTTNELSKLAKKDKKATTEENKSIKKNNMELIREKDINKDKENQSKSVEVNKKVESLKEGGKKEQLKVENKHQAIGEMSKDQIGKMEKEAVVKKEEQPIAASKVETVSTNEITQVKGTIDLSKAEKETIQGERKGFQEISSDTGAKKLSLDISSKSNSQLGVDSTPPKFKENDVKIKSVSDEKLADGSQKEKLKPKNDVATKKAANKEGVIATAKEKGKDLKLDINTSKQADMAASKGPQSKTAPILEGQRSSKVQTTNKEPTSAKTLENLNTTSKARKQSKEVIPKVRSPGIATTITTTVNTPTTEPKIIDDSNTAPVTGLMSASQELPENIEKKELSNVPSVPTRNSPNVTQKSNANAKSKTAEKQPQYAHGGVEKPPSKQSPSKSTVLPKSITSAVAKTSTKSEKQKMPSKAATDITPKLLQQPKNESTYTLNPVLTTPSVDSTDTTKDLESSNLAQKPVQSQEMSKEAPQAATAKINTNVSEVKSLQKTITTSEQTQQIMTTKSDIRKAPEQDMQISLSTSNVESKSSRQPTMKTNEKSKSSKQHQVKVSKISADKVQDADINEKALEELLTKIKNQENTAAHSTKNVSPTPLMEQLPVALSTPETGVKLEEKNEEVTVSTVSIVSVKTEPTALLVPLGEATTQQEAKYENRKSLETQVQESLSTLTIDKQEMGKLIQPLAQQQSNVPKSTDDATLSTNEVKIPSQFAISEIVAKKPPETSTVLDDQVKKQIASEKIVTQLQADNQCLPISEVNIQSPVQGLSLPSQVIGPIGEAQSEVCNPGNPLDKLQMSIVSAPLNASQPCAQIIQQMAFPNIIVEVSKQQSTFETKEAVRTEDQILEMPCGESKSVQMDAKSSLSKDLILPEAQTTLNQNIPKVELNVCTPEVQDSKQLVDQQKEQQTQRKHQQQQHQQKQQQ